MRYVRKAEESKKKSVVMLGYFVHVDLPIYNKHYKIRAQSN